MSNKNKGSKKQVNKSSGKSGKKTPAKAPGWFASLRNGVASEMGKDLYRLVKEKSGWGLFLSTLFGDGGDTSSGEYSSGDSGIAYEQYLEI